MKKIKFLSYLLIVSLFFMFEATTSCNKKEISIGKKEVPIMPIEPFFSEKLPTFPSWVLHVLQREYYHKKNTKTTKSDYYQYIEKRLIELYPEVAYEGMMEEVVLMTEKFKADYDMYEELLKKYYIANNLEVVELEEDNYREFTTLEDEIEYMAMTDDEINLFLELEKLATKKNLLTRKEIENYASSKGGILVLSFMQSAALMTGYSVWRVIQSRNRAENKTAEFYTTLGPGVKSDAFRHIYVSVLLRRYITRVGAHLVMNTYENLNPNDAKNKYMDFHNNKVGRHTQYWTFRGKRIKDRYKWKLWATRARNWVNNSSNGLIFGNWDTASDATIQSEENNASDYKYIIFKG